MNELNLTVALTAAYATTNVFRVFFYLPQIVAVTRERSRAQAIALATWWFWASANFTTALYALFVLRDGLLGLVNLGNTAGCATVAAITVYKRWRYRDGVSSARASATGSARA